MNKETLWDNYPNLKTFFETSNGTKFFKESDAKTHAATLEDKTVKTLNRPMEDAPKSPDDLTPMQLAKLRIEAIEALETVEAIEAALKGETAKTVIAAGNAKIEAIKASQTQD